MKKALIAVLAILVLLTGCSSLTNSMLGNGVRSRETADDSSSNRETRDTFSEGQEQKSQSGGKALSEEEKAKQMVRDYFEKLQDEYGLSDDQVEEFMNTLETSFGNMPFNEQYAQLIIQSIEQSLKLYDGGSYGDLFDFYGGGSMGDLFNKNKTQSFSPTEAEQPRSTPKPTATPKPTQKVDGTSGYKVSIEKQFENPQEVTTLSIAKTSAKPNAKGGYDCSVTVYSEYASTFALYYTLFKNGRNFSEDTIDMTLVSGYTLARDSSETFYFSIPANHLKSGDISVRITCIED